MDTRRYVNDDKRYEEIIKKIGIKQTAIFSREVLKAISNTTKGKTGEQKDEIALKMLYYNLNKIKFFNHMIKYHNNTYDIFNNKEMENPFIMDEQKLEEQYMKLQDNSQVEITTKKAQLENRFAKLCKYGRNKIIEQTAKGMSKQEYAKIYVNKIYKNILLSGRMEEFLDNSFKYYYKKEITKEEYSNLETTKLCQNLINESNGANNIDMEKAYIFMLYEHTHNTLMREKSKDIAKIVNIYAQEQKHGITSFGLNTKNDARILGENSMSITVNIPNYASPFKLHAPKSLIYDEEKRNNIKLEGKYDRNETNIMTLPLKISTEQINQIYDMTRYNPFAFRKKLEADEKRMNIVQYMKDNIYKKREYQQKVISDNIKQIKQKENELKQIKEEIKQKKETVRNLKEEIQSLKGNIEKSLEDN